MGRLTAAEYAKLHGAKAGQRLARERAARTQKIDQQIWKPPVADRQRNNRVLYPFGTPSQNRAINQTRRVLARPEIQAAQRQTTRDRVQRQKSLVKGNSRWYLNTQTPIGVMQSQVGGQLNNPKFQSYLRNTINKDVGQRIQLVGMASRQAEQPLSKLILQMNLDHHLSTKDANTGLNGSRDRGQLTKAAELTLMNGRAQAVNPFTGESMLQTAGFFGEKMKKAAGAAYHGLGGGQGGTVPIAGIRPPRWVDASGRVTQDLAEGFAKNAIDLPLGLTAGTYKLATDTAQGKFGEVGNDLTSAYKEFAKNPVNYARHNPLNTYFLLRPGYDIAGRGAGAAARGPLSGMKFKGTTFGDYASTSRLPLQVAPGVLRNRTYSKNLFTKRGQVFKDSRGEIQTVEDFSQPLDKPSLGKVVNDIAPKRGETDFDLAATRKTLDRALRSGKITESQYVRLTKDAISKAGRRKVNFVEPDAFDLPKSIKKVDKRTYENPDYNPTAEFINSMPAFHGSGTALNKGILNTEISKPGGLVGPALYTTFKMEVANPGRVHEGVPGYGGPGGHIHILENNVKNPVDLEAPFNGTNEFTAAVNQAFDDVYAHFSKGKYRNDKVAKRVASAKQTLEQDWIQHGPSHPDSTRAQLQDVGEPVTQLKFYQDALGAMRKAVGLENRTPWTIFRKSIAHKGGFDALVHKGGQHWGTHGDHMVVLHLDPEGTGSIKSFKRIKKPQRSFFGSLSKPDFGAYAERHTYGEVTDLGESALHSFRHQEEVIKRLTALRDGTGTPNRNGLDGVESTDIAHLRGAIKEALKGELGLLWDEWFVVPEKVAHKLEHYSAQIEENGNNKTGLYAKSKLMELDFQLESASLYEDLMSNAKRRAQALKQIDHRIEAARELMAKANKTAEKEGFRVVTYDSVHGVRHSLEWVGRPEKISEVEARAAQKIEDMPDEFVKRKVQVAKNSSWLQDGKWTQGQRELRRSVHEITNWFQREAWAMRDLATDPMRANAPFAGPRIAKTKRAANDLVGEVAAGSILRSTEKFPTRFRDQLEERLQGLVKEREGLVGTDLKRNKQLSARINQMLDLPDEALAEVESKIGKSAESYASQQANIDFRQEALGFPKDRAESARFQQYAVRQMGGRWMEPHEHPKWDEFEKASAEAARKDISKGRREKAAARAVELSDEVFAVQDRMVDPEGNPVTVDSIKTHMRENDVNAEQIGYVPTGRAKIGRRGYHQPFTMTKKAFKSGKFKGVNLRQGTHASTYQDLIDHIGSKEVVMHHIEGTNRALEQFGTLPEINGVRIPAGSSALRNALHNAKEETGLEYVAIRDTSALGDFVEGDLRAKFEGSYTSQDITDLVSKVISRRLESPKSGEQVILVPKIVVDEIQLMNEAATRIPVVTPLTNAFRRTVLPFSPTVHVGDMVEGSARGLLAGATPRSHRYAREVLDPIREVDKLRYESLRQALYGNMRLASQERWITRGKASARADEIPYVGATLRGLGTFSQLAYSVNRTFVRQFEQGVLGKWMRDEVNRIKRDPEFLKELEADVKEFGKDAGKAIDAQAKAIEYLQDMLMGKRGEKEALAKVTEAARHLEAAFGRYQNFSPGMRRAVGNGVPFLPWALNAVRFFTYTLPVKHPLTTALIVNMENAVSQDFKDEMTRLATTKNGKVSHELEYGGIPDGKGGIRNIGRYGPQAAWMDPFRLISGEFMPQFSGIVLAMAGRTWTYMPVTDSTGEELDKNTIWKWHRALYALGVAAETYIPLASQTRRTLTKDAKQYPDSTIFNWDPKPGTERSYASAWNPFKSVQPNASGDSKTIVNAFGKKVDVQTSTGPKLDITGKPIKKSPKSSGKTIVNAYGQKVKVP